MKKRNLLITLMLVGICIKGFAQEFNFGVYAGMNVSKLNESSYNVYNTQPRIGYQIGGEATYTTKANIVLGAGLEVRHSSEQFAIMSDHVSATGQRLTAFPKVKATDISMNLPIHIGYKFSLADKMYLIPNIGINFGYGIAAIKDDVTISMGSEKDETDKWSCYDGYTKGAKHIDAFNRISVSPYLGLDIIISKHYLLGVSHQWGITNTYDQYGCKKQSSSIKIGYIF